MKAQVSFEYLMVFGLALAFAIPVWIYVVSMQQTTGEELSLSYAKNVASQVTSAADLVYTQGPPAKVRLNVYVPSRIEDINISGKWITVNVISSGGISNVTSTSKANMTGSVPSSEGSYRISIESMGDLVSITPE